MALSYAQMKFPPMASRQLEWKNDTFLVKEYLTIEEKNALIDSCIQKSERIDGTISIPVMEMHFVVGIIFEYTDIKFTDHQKQTQIDKIYDNFVRTGLWEKIKEAIPPKEMVELKRMLDQALGMKERTANSTVSFLKQIFSFANADAMQKIVDEFDTEKYQQVIDFAKAANAGRPVLAPA